MKTKAQKKDDAGYSISQVSERTGYSADTLRLYEKAGLLPGVMKRGGRRVYTEENLRSIRLIGCLKKTGMPLAEIAEFMRLATRGDATVKKRFAMMRKRAEAVEAMMKDIKACADHIAFKVWYYETAAKEGLVALADYASAVERYRRETGRKFSL